jgi:hypothetical protein
MEGIQAAMTTRNLEQDRWRNGGMVFGFRKKAKAVIILDIDRYLKSHTTKLVDVQIL